ncbi:hypothetical protein, partial [Streptomyces sp. NPDC018347]|uniref:hypothetical protein n=1 Tax=Streptomyces sp. NPDC018347 TaxID=3157193 RepID=UPI0033FB7551
MREQAICQLIAKAFNQTDYTGPAGVVGWRWGVDLALHHQRVIVEYDGWYWHRDKAEKDLLKTRVLEKAPPTAETNRTIRRGNDTPMTASSIDIDTLRRLP